MVNLGNKKLVCITGSVWTGRRIAPRKMLLKDGFCRPTWFTTDRRLTDAQYRQVSATEFHLALAQKRVVAHVDYGGSDLGIMQDDFESALIAAERGVLVVGPPEIAAQFAKTAPQVTIFAFKGVDTDLSRPLEDANRSGRLHRIDIDVLKPGAWEEVYRYMVETLGLPPRNNPLA